MKGISERKLGQVEVESILGFFDQGEVQEMLRERCRNAALEFCIALIQEEVDLLCGQAFSREEMVNRDRRFSRRYPKQIELSKIQD